MRERTEGEERLIMRCGPIFHRGTSGSIIGPGYGSGSTIFAIWTFGSTVVVTRCAPPRAFSREVKARVRGFVHRSRVYGEAVQYHDSFEKIGAAEKNMRYILHTIRMDQSERTAGVPVTYLFVKDPFPPSLAQ
jgi:hypothetical protein